LDGLESVQRAFAFVTSPFFVDSNIIGATTLTQLKTDIDGCMLTLSDAVLSTSSSSTSPTPILALKASRRGTKKCRGCFPESRYQLLWRTG
jgi:hypothetical protein